MKPEFSGRITAEELLRAIQELEKERAHINIELDYLRSRMTLGNEHKMLGYKMTEHYLVGYLYAIQEAIAIISTIVITLGE